jgi:SSS family solute:Na+ symporter
VFAAALSAMMSTASGALIACATVATNDIWKRVRPLLGRGTARDPEERDLEQRDSEERDELRGNRIAILVLGLVVIGIACMLSDVVSALTIAYNLLVGGLLVPILGALVWRRGNLQGAMASIVAGGVTVIVMMAVKGVLANEPIYYGLGISLVAYMVVSLATRPTDAAVLDAWRRRLAGEQPEGAAETAETAEPVSSGT